MTGVIAEGLMTEVGLAVTDELVVLLPVDPVIPLIAGVVCEGNSCPPPLGCTDMESIIGRIIAPKGLSQCNSRIIMLIKSVRTCVFHRSMYIASLMLCGVGLELHHCYYPGIS